MVDVSKVKFTKHATEKFVLLNRYGFGISVGSVMSAVLNPDRLERRNNQFFAVKLLDSKYALRVVYEKRKGFLVVITFYPVRRERYGL
ncbi:MAG: hypothetical protein QXL91_02305 [Candidatus Bathyarchaeia archaeon]